LELPLLHDPQNTKHAHYENNALLKRPKKTKWVAHYLVLKLKWADLFLKTKLG
jgi:hypothetical protein